MPHSPLISGTLLTDNCYQPRSSNVDTITPHYMAWYTDAETCCESFVPASRRASANYCIGKDGEIWLNVDEDNGAWTSGNYVNDNRAITIECANYMEDGNGHVYGQLPQVTWDSLVALCADIATRYGYERVVYNGGLDYSNEGGILLTKHKWFQATDCPGPWLDQQFERLAEEATAAMSGTPYVPHNNTHGGELDVDGMGGYNTILDMQHWLGTEEDGLISGQCKFNRDYFWSFNYDNIDWSCSGSLMVMALQRKLGIDEDGRWGRSTSSALQNFLIGEGFDCGPSGMDGMFGSDSMCALQRFLNQEI